MCNAQKFLFEFCFTHNFRHILMSVLWVSLLYLLAFSTEALLFQLLYAADEEEFLLNSLTKNHQDEIHLQFFTKIVVERGTWIYYFTWWCRKCLPSFFKFKFKTLRAFVRQEWDSIICCNYKPQGQFLDKKAKCFEILAEKRQFWKLWLILTAEHCVSSWLPKNFYH